MACVTQLLLRYEQFTRPNHNLGSSFAGDINPTMHYLTNKLYTAPSSTINHANSATIHNNLRRTGTGTTSQPRNSTNGHKYEDMATHTIQCHASMLNLYPPSTTSQNVVGPTDVINGYHGSRVWIDDTRLFIQQPATTRVSSNVVVKGN